MGIRARAMVKSPEYGTACVSASVKVMLCDYLIDAGVALTSTAEDDAWEMYIDESLREAVHDLCHGAAAFEGILPASMRGRGYGADAGAMLAEGISAMDAEGTNYLVIEWRARK